MGDDLIAAVARAHAAMSRLAERADSGDLGMTDAADVGAIVDALTAALGTIQATAESAAAARGGRLQ